MTFNAHLTTEDLTDFVRMMCIGSRTGAGEMREFVKDHLSFYLACDVPREKILDAEDHDVFVRDPPQGEDISVSA